MVCLKTILEEEGKDAAIAGYAHSGYRGRNAEKSLQKSLDNFSRHPFLPSLGGLLFWPKKRKMMRSSGPHFAKFGNALGGVLGYITMLATSCR